MIHLLKTACHRSLLSLYAEETGQRWAQPAVICDMDGVLADFVTGFEQYHELPKIVWKPGEYSIAAKTGISLDTLPEEFWATLPAHELLAPLRGVIASNTFSVIASRCNPDLLHARAMWLLHHDIPRLPYVLQSLKADMFDMNPNAVLIDDCDEEIDAWPGPKILVPRPWNSNREKDPYRYTIARAMALGLLGPTFTYSSPAWDATVDAYLEITGETRTLADLRAWQQKYGAAADE